VPATPTPPIVPDVDAYDGPLLDGAKETIARLARGELTPDQYQDAIAALFDRIDPVAALAEWTARALEEGADQILYRRTTPTTAVWFQLLHLRAREVHPPHCHRNLISNQVLLHGRSYLREYDRVCRLDDSTLLLKLRSDRWMSVGDRIRTTEIDRNAHWFCADDAPAVQLNFFVVGYQDWLFDRHLPARRGRTYLDPTLRATPDGLIVTPEISVEVSEAKFQGRPILDFPQPAPEHPAAAA